LAGGAYTAAHVKGVLTVGTAVPTFGTRTTANILTLLFCACEGMHDFLESLEANDAIQKEHKAAEKYRQHQITLLRQQIANLEERRDQLQNVFSQLHSQSVSFLVVFSCQ